MIISKEDETNMKMTNFFPQRFYFGSRYWVYKNQTSVACYDDVQCEDQCCQDMDFNLPYCCSKYMGFVYLGLMFGGGIIIAVLAVICYICMTRKERELQAAAKLEAAKTVNSQHIPIDYVLHPGSQGIAPPTYSDAITNYPHCDPDVTSRQALDLVSLFLRQHGHIDQMFPLPPLPPLVDVSALIDDHRLSQVQIGGLPPISSQVSIDQKLPTYEQCIAAGQSVRMGQENSTLEETPLAASQVFDLRYIHDQDSQANQKLNQLCHAYEKTASDSHTVEMDTPLHQVKSSDGHSDESHFIDVASIVQHLNVTQINGQAVLQATDDVKMDVGQQMTNSNETEDV